jgi:hypothetical protein
MRHQNLNAFLNEDKHHGVYVFTSYSCELCEQFEKDLSQYDTSSFVAIEVMRDEEIILTEMFGLKGFPFAVVFVENEIGLIKKGVLFQKQMNEIYNFLKQNNIKTEQANKIPITQTVPVILESPFRGDAKTNTEYVKLAIQDSVERGESPVAFHLLYSDIYDINNPQHNAIVKKLKESWSLLSKKTVVYIDEGVSEGMLDGITDAAARGKEIEFRKIYEN